MIRAMLAGAMLMSCAGATAADGWRGFYTPSRPAAAALHLDALPAIGAVSGDAAGDPCLDAILAAQAAFGIPRNLLLAIGYQEAGRTVDGRFRVWPWTVNVAGRGHHVADRQTAINLVDRALRAGTRSIDVGCLQVNLKWHPEAFATLAEAFDPTANARYAARFLADLRAETGSWTAAAAAYHSRTPEHAEAYLDGLRTHLAAVDDRLAARSGTTARHFAVAPNADLLPALGGPRPDTIALPAPSHTAPQPPAGTSGPIWGASMDGRADAGAGSLFGRQGAAPLSDRIKPLF